MVSTRAMFQAGTAAFLAVALAGTAAPAAAQGPNEGVVRISGGLDLANGYMFRGLRQDREVEQLRRGQLREDRDLVLAPRLNLGVRVWEGQGELQSIGVRVETSNRLHSGPTGRRGEGQAMWNESALTMALQLGMGRGVSTEIGYTDFNSPNNLGLSARELFLRIDMDDTHRGRASVRPYGLIAGEIDARRAGSADCQGLPGREYGRPLNPGEVRIACRGGSYAELGATPTYDGGRYTVDFPVRVGFSLRDYYIHPTQLTDKRWGFASLGVLGTLPFTQQPTRFGSWYVHGGVEWHTLGATPRAWNVDIDGRPKPNRVIGLVGIGFTY